jgi:hypothetical protein
LSVITVVRRDAAGREFWRFRDVNIARPALVERPRDDVVPGRGDEIVRKWIVEHVLEGE